MTRIKGVMTESNTSVFRTLCTDNTGKQYQFKGVYGNIEQFKNAVRLWYSNNIGANGAYSLVFEKTNNIGPIVGVNESAYIQI